LFDVMPPVAARDAFLSSHHLDASKPVVALLPGSRANEVREILQGLLDAAVMIRRELPDVQFVIARAPHLADDLFARARAASFTIVEGVTDDVLASATLAIVASGTVTVQAALHECPMVVVYRLSSLTYRLGRPFVHVDTFAMANLVAGHKAVPELIQDDFTPQAVAQHALTLLQDPQAAEQMRQELRSVKAKLGAAGASRRAAAAVLSAAAARRLG
jgi:lipid-A-disaccharide synthase